jgi:hypothetical protein
MIEFTKSINYNDFKTDKMRKLAVERQLEIIGQAANKINKETPKEKLPSISKKVWWREVRPTFSKSLCFPSARTTFWQLAAREYGRSALPKKVSLNWFIPTVADRKCSMGKYNGFKK